MTKPVLDFWPYCSECHQPFEFSPDEPFAHCKCGTTEWGDPRPAKWVVDPRAPINMVLHCPNCMQQHIDAPDGEWTNPPHKSHLCAICGHIWRPADVPTNGVHAVQTRGKNDS